MKALSKFFIFCLGFSLFAFQIGMCMEKGKEKETGTPAQSLYYSRSETTLRIGAPVPSRQSSQLLFRFDGDKYIGPVDEQATSDNPEETIWEAARPLEQYPPDLAEVYEEIDYYLFVDDLNRLLTATKWGVGVASGIGASFAWTGSFMSTAGDFLMIPREGPVPIMAIIGLSIFTFPAWAKQIADRVEILLRSFCCQNKFKDLDNGTKLLIKKSKWQYPTKILLVAAPAAAIALIPTLELKLIEKDFPEFFWATSGFFYAVIGEGLYKVGSDYFSRLFISNHPSETIAIKRKREKLIVGVKMFQKAIAGETDGELTKATYTLIMQYKRNFKERKKKQEDVEEESLLEQYPTHIARALTLEKQESPAESQSRWIPGRNTPTNKSHTDMSWSIKLVEDLSNLIASTSLLPLSYTMQIVAKNILSSVGIDPFVAEYSGYAVQGLTCILLLSHSDSKGTYIKNLFGGLTYSRGDHNYMRRALQVVATCTGALLSVPFALATYGAYENDDLSSSIPATAAVGYMWANYFSNFFNITYNDLFTRALKLFSETDIGAKKALVHSYLEDYIAFLSEADPKIIEKF